MGATSTKAITYGEWTGEEKEGQTRILRHPDFINKELPTEPIEGLDTVWKAFEYSVNQFDEKNFLGTRKYLEPDKYGDYIWKSYKDIFNDVKSFAGGLTILNLCPDIHSQHDGTFKFMGIFCKNREEWVVTSLACHLTSTTIVTFYETLGEHVIEYILNQTKLTSLVMEAKSFKKLIELRKNYKHSNLENLIILDMDENDPYYKDAIEAGYKVFKFSDIINSGINFRKNNDTFQFLLANPETIVTICYTSGTTGLPKGAMMSHKNLMAEAAGLWNTDIDLGSSDFYLSYLPLAHSFEMMGITFCMMRGVSIGFFQGNPAKLVEDAQLLKPTVFIGVPRVYHRIYDTIQNGLNKLGYIKHYLATRAVKSKLYNYQNYGSLTHPIWDRLIFNKTKLALGGRVRIMLSAAAPIDPNILDFLKICFCCPIMEGYGQTETCAGATLTKADDFHTGTVGGLMPCNEMKLIDCEALNYKSTDKDDEGNSIPSGEICLRGGNVISGYFNDLDKTNSLIDDEGWMHTGDVGRVISSMGNALKIIDRVKNIFKLSHGEYIAPEKIENILIKSKYVNQIFVYGESLQNFLVAIVIPNNDKCIEFLDSMGIICSKENVNEFYANQDLIKEILKDMEEVGRENGIKGFEIVKKCYLSKEPFTVENEMLTPTMKIKRNEAKMKYIDQINKMYSR